VFCGLYKCECGWMMLCSVLIARPHLAGATKALQGI
jgi:hypothetical protein